VGGEYVDVSADFVEVSVLFLISVLNDLQAIALFCTAADSVGNRNNIPGTKPIGVHYDQIFLRYGEPTSVTAWVPIGDVKVNGGGLIYLEDGIIIGLTYPPMYPGTKDMAQVILSAVKSKKSSPPKPNRPA
jgi:hypothetical protein